MKLTINVPDSMVRMILREQLALTPAGVKKVMSDPRFQRAMRREAQILYSESLVEEQGEFIHEIVFGALRLAKKYQRGEQS